MASYGTKYYGYYDLRDGAQIRVLIQQKDYSGSTYRIAHMTGLSLEVGGGNDPIYAPIVKTTVRFSMRDVYDEGGSGAISGGDKNGQWEEFYTNDATKYKVILRYEPASGSATVLWTGFITPDSWQEDMYYHGNINITARDMLGSLADYDFDDEGTNGMSTIQNIITHAVEKCQAAMSVTCDASMALVHQNNNDSASSIFYAMVNVATFKGRSWWDALNDTLEALGLVMRYNGQNGWTVASLRYIPTILNRAQHTCEFINHSGVRQLDPPVRDISGEFRAEIEAYALKPYDESDLASGTTIYSAWLSLAQPALAATKNELPANSGDFGPKLFNPSNPDPSLIHKPTNPSLIHKPTKTPHSLLYDAGFTGYSRMYFVANTVPQNWIPLVDDPTYGEVAIKANFSKFPARLVVEQDGMMLTENASYAYPLEANNSNPPILKSVDILITASIGGTLMYFNGSTWIAVSSQYDTRLVTINIEAGSGYIDIPAPSSTVRQGNISICRVEVGGYAKRTPSDVAGVYVPLRFSFTEPEGSDLADLYTVKTIYNEAYNVRISRTPAIGSVDSNLPSRNVNNVLVRDDAIARNTWRFYGMSSSYPLEVMVQAQLLQLYAAAGDGNNYGGLSLFTGALHDKTYDWALPGMSYLYYGRPCILLRGTFDFTTGFVRDAALREYLTWEEVWGSNFNPQYTIVAERTGGGESSGGSSSGGGGGGGGTTVEWGTSPATGFQQLKVGGDTTHIVALDGHGHAISEIDGLQNALNDKQATLTFDNTPIAGSNNPVKSSGIKAAIDAISVATSITDILSAPSVQIFRQVRPASAPGGLNVANPLFHVRHPLLALDTPDELGQRPCVVLMRWHPRRSRPAASDYNIYRTGWGEAKGGLATTTPGQSGGTEILAPTWYNPAGTESGIKAVGLDVVRLWLLQHYVCSFENGEQQCREMSLAAFRVATDAHFRFGAKFYGDLPSGWTLTDWKNHTNTSWLFGFAVRIPNPEFVEAVSYFPQHDLVDTTRELMITSEGQTKVYRRYFYTEVTPFRAFVNMGPIGNGNKWEIGFRIEGGPPK